MSRIINSIKGVILFSTILCVGHCKEPIESDLEKGLRISQETNQFNDGFFGDSSETELEIINAHGDKIVRKMSQKSMEQKGDGDRSLITFQWPADVKGTRMLTWSHKKKNDDQWLYLPSLKRVKRINSRNQSGSFMGSEFYYEDLSSVEVEKYVHKFVKEGKINDRDVWVIDRDPVNRHSGYSKLRVYIDKVYMNPLTIEYFDRKGELLKTAKFSKYTKHGKYYRQGRIEMVNHQTGKQSNITWSKLTLNKKYKSKEFTKNALDSF
ncbi:MAG: outer membrane lipoprotein-sorting protein [Candidatus Cloacimonetes bacterium]|nr:outer membrane lipoprotein-sorting protein [Candidatus Cloacimonadota bacterium]